MRPLTGRKGIPPWESNGAHERGNDMAAAGVPAGGAAILDGVLAADPLSNTVLREKVPCLPHTQYEVTVFEKHDISAKADYYGAFAVIGNISGTAYNPETGYTSYVGVQEIFNADVGAAGWTAHTVRFVSACDYFTITLGVGAAATGTASFDAVVVRDLTTRRYEYIYGMGSRLAKLEYEGDVGAAQVYYYHQDVLGSPVMMTDIDRAEMWRTDYGPFGETLEAEPVNWGNPYTYLGNEDDGGLMDFNTRFYDARIGRFINPDPIRTVNPYVYCLNNPLKFTDKSGLKAAPQNPLPGDRPTGGPGGGGGGDPKVEEKMWEGYDWYDPLINGPRIYSGCTYNQAQLHYVWCHSFCGTAQEIAAKFKAFASAIIGAAIMKQLQNSINARAQRQAEAEYFAYLYNYYSDYIGLESAIFFQNSPECLPGQGTSQSTHPNYTRGVGLFGVDAYKTAELDCYAIAFNIVGTKLERAAVVGHTECLGKENISYTRVGYIGISDEKWAGFGSNVSVPGASWNFNGCDPTEWNGTPIIGSNTIIAEFNSKGLNATRTPPDLPNGILTPQGGWNAAWRHVRQ
jgi:RHS repeat-associated protein